MGHGVLRPCTILRKWAHLSGTEKDAQLTQKLSTRSYEAEGICRMKHEGRRTCCNVEVDEVKSDPRVFRYQLLIWAADKLASCCLRLNDRITRLTNSDFASTDRSPRIFRPGFTVCFRRDPFTFYSYPFITTARPSDSYFNTVVLDFAKPL